MTCVYCGTNDNPDWCYCRIMKPLLGLSNPPKFTDTGNVEMPIHKLNKNQAYGRALRAVPLPTSEERRWSLCDDGGAEEYFEADMQSASWLLTSSHKDNISIDAGERRFAVFDEPALVTVLFPDGERQIKCDDMGRPCRVPGYKYEQTITGEWFAT